VLTLALLLAAGSARAESGFRAGYDLHLGGFRVGEMQTEVRLEGDRYFMRVVTESRGMLGWLVDLHSEVEAEGVIAEGRLIPERYRTDTRRNQQERAVRLTFARDGFVEQLEIRPEPDHEPVPKDFQRAPDPLSALLEITRAVLDPASPAAHTFTTFGGLRALRLSIECPHYEPVRLAALGLPGQALRCDVEAEQLAGPPPDQDIGLSIEELGTLWLVPLEHGGVLVRARMRSQLGAVVVRISHFEPLTARVGW
jgi:hypothetical protein